jgi:hypothetical protein
MRLDHREIRTGLVWLRIGTGGGAIVNRAMNLPVPQNPGKLLSSCTTDSFFMELPLELLDKHLYAVVLR